MYTIVTNLGILYDPRIASTEYKLSDAKLTLDDNGPGKLDFAVPKSNRLYSNLGVLTTIVYVMEDDNIIWEGRIITESNDFYGNRKFTAEGCLNYLCDSIQPQYYYSGVLTGYFSRLLSQHNSRVTDPVKQFQMGGFPSGASETVHYYTNYDSTMDNLKDDILEKRTDLHIKLHWYNTGDGIWRKVISLLSDSNLTTASQTIKFGSNLLDFTKNFTIDDIATVIIPLGAKQETEVVSGLDAYLTVESVNSGDIHVYASDTVLNKLGRIEKVVNWDDVTLPNNLLNKAKNYISSAQFEEMEISISAVDLHEIDPTVNSIKVGQKVRCISEYHGMDTTLVCTQMEVDILHPESVQYKIGNKTSVSLTSKSTTMNNDLSNKVKSITQSEQATINSTLAEAKTEAAELINSSQVGYITIVSDESGTSELLITNTQDPKAATKLWRWNIAGLGYSKDGGKTYEVAMTMDGKINADFVNTGTLNAAVIKAGTISDVNNKNSWNLETGSLVTTSGSIGGWTISNDGISKTMSAWFNPTTEDRLRIRNYLLGTGTLTDDQKKWYDFNNDGKVTAVEIAYINRMLKGLTTIEEIHNQTGYVIPKFPITFKIRSVDSNLDFESNSIEIVAKPFGVTQKTFVGPNGLKGYLESQGIIDSSNRGININGGSWYYSGNADYKYITPQKFIELGRGHGSSIDHLDRDANKIEQYDDLNRFTGLGQFWCGSGTDAATISNIPCFVKNSGFKLIVTTVGGDNWWNGQDLPNKGDKHRLQILITNAGEIWTRQITGVYDSSTNQYTHDYLSYDWQCHRGYKSGYFTANSSGNTYDLSNALKSVGDAVEVWVTSKNGGCAKYIVCRGSSADVITKVAGSWNTGTLTVNITGTSTHKIKTTCTTSVSNCRYLIKPIIQGY